MPFPTIELSSAKKVKSTGLKSFRFNDQYAAVGKEGVNSVREVWSIGWEEITWDEAADIENYFIGLGGSNFEWTPPGQSSPRNFRVLSDSISTDFEKGYDGASVSLTIAEDFRNG
tara:strand:- start:452 stop:796 length:345 start_codon:yes stop_codon:yes gene_type:complete